MKRMFFALPIPEAIEEETERCRTGLPGVNWSRGLHLTLHFLGDVPPEQEEGLESLLADVQAPALELRLGSPGVFARPGQMILWLRCLPEDPVLAVKRQLDRGLARMGLRLDRRFHPHVTIGRARSIPAGRLDSYLLHHEEFVTSPFRVDEIALFSSVLSRDGARHTMEAVCRLG